MAEDLGASEIDGCLLSTGSQPFEVCCKSGIELGNGGLIVRAEGLPHGTHERLSCEEIRIDEGREEHA